LALAIGTQLGSLEVTALIGRGGMGEVYRARDTKLKRDVAIKILPDEFSRDADRLSRFQREAEVLASLNHPNIAAIYDLQEANGSRYLVLELVQGETLAERIARGPTPVEEALDIAKNICEALEAAHEKGIVHRDLKPANIKLTPAGQLKVLDFGLAKIAEAQAVTDFSNSPTLVSGSAPGVILGTAAYMSPEQATGKEVDKRTDIWALGCVLYELLTGKQAFSGDTVTEILAAVLKSEPDWSALPEATPLHLRSLLRLCLQKDAKKRLRDAADIQIEIEEALTAPATVPPQAAAVAAHRLWRRALLWAAGLAALVSIAAVVGFRLLSPASSPTQSLFTQFAMEFAADQQLAGVNVPAVDFSPDGKQVAYVASRGGSSQLYLRALDSVAKPLPGTGGAYGPFFSPDGQWIGFFAGGKLKKVAVKGGAPIAVTDVPLACGASWPSNDNILFTPFQFQGVMEVPASGGTPRALTNLDIQNGEI